MKYIRTKRGNLVLDGCEGFYVSFIPGHFNPSGISLFKSDTPAGETALVKDGNFYILNGDHREQYLMLAKLGFDKCKEYFNNHKDQMSSWSDDD